jgi:hypothetical protein
MQLRKATTKNERKKRVLFATGMAAIDGGKPTDYTKKLLRDYENGVLTSSEVKKAILAKYTNIK